MRAGLPIMQFIAESKARRPGLDKILVSATMRLALFQPDIPQNTGAMIRLAVCLGVAVDIIEPCGFIWSGRHLRRAGLDYLDRAVLVRHPSWDAFRDTLAARGGRSILLTTRASIAHTEFVFRPDDHLLLGRETAGAPEFVHDTVDARIRVPIDPLSRSLNVALAAAIVLGEALRQTGQYPKAGP